MYLDEERPLPIRWEISICKRAYLVESKSVLDAFHQVITGPWKPDVMGLIFAAREFPDGDKYYFNSEEALKSLGVWEQYVYRKFLEKNS